jgi:molybdenum cofactor biosynthesis protein MoaC
VKPFDLTVMTLECTLCLHWEAFDTSHVECICIISIVSSTDSTVGQYRQHRPRHFRAPYHLLSGTNAQQISLFHSSISLKGKKSAEQNDPPQHLTHLTAAGEAHMVDIGNKPHTTRRAIAIGNVFFSNPKTLELIRSALLKKGDVLSTARIAGIMAAKQCPNIIPLCHPIALTSVKVDAELLADNGSGQTGVGLRVEVVCVGPTGVEMEAMTGVMGAALTVVDMVKGVDRGVYIKDVKLILKEGGRSGKWVDETSDTQRST